MSESEDVIDQSNHILALLEERKRKREGEHLLEVLPQGEGSGLDADKVDGLHADDIVENARKSIVVKAGGSGGGNIDTTGLLRADGTVPVTDYIDMHEHAVPANPAADTLRLYVEDVKGFPFFSFRDETGMIRKIVRDSVFVGKNVTGVTIPQFRAVYASGSADGVPTLALAKADSILTMPSIGITTEAIADGAYGRVMQVGLAENVNTNAFTEGDVIYVSAATAGLGTNVAPVYPNIAQEIGTVLVKDAAVGMFQCVARSMNNALGVGEHPQYVEVAGDTMTGDLNVKNLLPVTDDLYDLGSATKEFQDGFFDGTVTMDKLSLSSTVGEGVLTSLLPAVAGSPSLGSFTRYYNNIMGKTLYIIDATTPTNYWQFYADWDQLLLYDQDLNNYWIFDLATTTFSIFANLSLLAGFDVDTIDVAGAVGGNQTYKIPVTANGTTMYIPLYTT